MARLLPLYLDKEAVVVIEGGVAETTELLKLPFDHIMYTGNGQVGKIVLRAAAEHLTPVTLELGGKSPVYVDSSADLKLTAQRIAWGKWLNAGQTCIAPDYILAHKDIAESLLREIHAQLLQMYGSDPKLSPDYGRIVNQRHLQRVQSYLDGIEVYCGGAVDVVGRLGLLHGLPRGRRNQRRPAGVGRATAAQPTFGCTLVCGRHAQAPNCPSG